MRAFVTGYPGFIGKRLVRELLRVDADATVVLLVQPKFVDAARSYLERLEAGERVAIVTGDVADMHLGLSAAEFRRCARETTHVFHLAAISYLGMPAETARRVNVEGTRNVIELAKACERLERLVHFSSCYVSGNRQGVIAEDELEQGQAFRNVYEETKYEAERLMQRAKAQLPITIVRPATVVGDSKTGEIDRFDGPYYLGMLLVLSPLVLPLPLPGNGVAPLNVVPVDFVVQAVLALTRNPAAIGKTVHLVDPNPMSARRVYELIAERANKRLPRFRLSARATDLFLRLPGVEKRARPQRAAISYVNHLALYNCRVALELLDGSGVRCPPLSSYLETLVTYALESWKARKDGPPATEEIDDPLDSPTPGKRS